MLRQVRHRLHTSAQSETEADIHSAAKLACLSFTSAGRNPVNHETLEYLQTIWLCVMEAEEGADFIPKSEFPTEAKDHIALTD